ncbi:nicotinate (nicotinamide) nucleotide adenylyltransferase [Blattabacterium cuenoti]|uniref:nicotinate (nicotinamide) nucleotide adenylyltransferase n=1 Tax=Blattabacterium cuenoti TaxID=1653831 RepID=UPI00163B6E05|nr:nicotinate (nicotinamide) nucleotide adenylyltransferase [Blattabacterium cuenoti]
MIKNNTVLYFGSFNPIHIGHVIIANYVLEFLENIKYIWFIVSPKNPLKNNIIDYNIREIMVKMAIKNFEKMYVLDIESRFYPSYTINTINIIKMKYPTKKFYFLIGKDILCSLKKWKNYKLILSENEIIVYPRLGKFNIPIYHNVKKIIFLKNAPIIDISSSFIRNSIKKGKNIRSLLDNKVWNYITKNNIYN